MRISEKSPLQHGSALVSQDFVVKVDNMVTAVAETCKSPIQRRSRREANSAVCKKNPVRPLIEAALAKTAAAAKQFVESQQPRPKCIVESRQPSKKCKCEFSPGSLFYSEVDGEPFDLGKYLDEYHGKLNAPSINKSLQLALFFS